MEKIQEKIFRTLRLTLLVLWRFYQVVIGVILVMVCWAFLQVADYFKVFDILDLQKYHPETTSFMEIEQARLDTMSGEDVDRSIHYTWLSIDSIPMVIQELVLIAEDAKFYQHAGFDLSEIEYAIVANHQKGERARGASTITQQLVKNLYLSSQKRMSRKVHEAGITILMENFLAKDRILELYLNIAQFGPGVFGVAEGAQYHFGKSVSELTLAECTQLTAVIPSPLHWDVKSYRRSYLSHKNRVVRNYALYKGMKNSVDFENPEWKQQVFEQLVSIVEEKKWGRLTTKPKTVVVSNDIFGRSSSESVESDYESADSKNVEEESASDEGSW